MAPEGPGTRLALTAVEFKESQMFPNRLALAVLAVACVGAAAGGGYLAQRQNTVTIPAAAQTQTQPADFATSSPSTAPAEKPVQETEAVVGDLPKSPAAPVAPAASPTGKAAKHAEPAPAARTSTRETSRRATASRDTHSEQRTAAAHQPPPLASSWPSSAGSQQPAPSTQQPPSAASDNATTTSRSDERASQDPPRAAEPPQKTFEELIVSADSVMGLQIENRISSETARIEDKVDAKVTRDVKVGDRVAIPAGSKALGSVMLVERGGKFKERARLGIRFHTLVLADGTRVPISTETIYREGEAPGNASAAKVGGGAVGGAILGAILGGAKGALAGILIGAGGTIAATEGTDVELPAGTVLRVRLDSPLAL